MDMRRWCIVCYQIFIQTSRGFLLNQMNARKSISYRNISLMDMTMTDISSQVRTLT